MNTTSLGDGLVDKSAENPNSKMNKFFDEVEEKLQGLFFQATDSNKAKYALAICALLWIHSESGQSRRRSSLFLPIRGVTPHDIVRKQMAGKNWQRAYLERLEEKGYIDREMIGGQTYYKAADEEALAGMLLDALRADGIKVKQCLWPNDYEDDELVEDADLASPPSPPVDVEQEVGEEKPMRSTTPKSVADLLKSLETVTEAMTLFSDHLKNVYDKLEEQRKAISDQNAHMHHMIGIQHEQIKEQNSGLLAMADMLSERLKNLNASLKSNTEAQTQAETKIVDSTAKLQTFLATSIGALRKDLHDNTVQMQVFERSTNLMTRATELSEKKKHLAQQLMDITTEEEQLAVKLQHMVDAAGSKK